MFVDAESRRTRQLLAVIPWEPKGNVGLHLFDMDHQCLQILEWIHLVELAGMNDAHVNVAHRSAIGGLVEHRILAMQDRLLERALANIMPTPGLCRVPWRDAIQSGGSRFLGNRFVGIIKGSQGRRAVDQVAGIESALGHLHWHGRVRVP